MESTPYVGGGPYCYANSFATVLGAKAPSTAVIEFATSSAFGMEVINVPKNPLVFFDPYGWDPLKSFDDALEAMGWRCTQIIGKDAQDALASLKAALQNGPVFVGPVEMGLLKHQPNARGPIGADHYVVILGIDNDTVEMHDPHGYPYATLPLQEFMAAWKTDSLGYGKSYTMRTDFKQFESLTEEDVIRRSIPNALKHLNLKAAGVEEMPPGSAANEAATKWLCDRIEVGLPDGMRAHFVYFAVQVGARRSIDAATCLSRVGYTASAAVMDKIARTIGALQYPLTQKRDEAAFAILQKLGPMYEELRGVLETEAKKTAAN
ncbi:RADC family protein [Cordyceps fumosorosea ARSEF 2679]|uniref:RADC family protein n=1 Tax=Cordyceps fumosorosea (strain ARSEF 2679) TaxID=1081104 RepID=A0A167TNQ5_CORFA|nr:RADC family protein [Cordyceps fumosorosea ARSEF 2679]OAA60788.1 RADC family protein [Cordyceps fumosorosea ARSEF 2679]